MLGLYIHVPFCSAICNYCNFNRGLFDLGLKDRYVEALTAEIRTAALKRPSTSEGVPDTAREEVDTVFFGGGTPSLLEPDEIGRIINACAGSFDLASDREVTLEANPESVSEARLADFRAAGVNRISFGVQSFREDELRRLSRLHDVPRARAAVAEARAAGFDNVSIDLMMWLPAQRVADWLESIDGAVDVAPDHLSLYLLEVYPNAPLKDEMARARWSQAPDDDAAAMYLTAFERLDGAGYEQYQISNAARPGKRSRHNLKYWADGEWLGFGCGAHSTQGGVRWKNVAATDEYVARVGRGDPTAVDVRKLTADERLGDALFTGLRLSNGVNLDDIGKRYGVDVWSRFGADLEFFLAEGCLRREGPRLRLTRRGMLIAHEVMAVFV